MRIEIAEPLDRWLQSQGCFEQVAGALQDRLGAWRGQSPRNKRISDFLNGTPLGHSLHAMLTDLTIGAWTAALIPRRARAGRRRRAPRPARTRCSPLAWPPYRPRRWPAWPTGSTRTAATAAVGLAHAVTNTTASLLMGGSLLLRCGAAGRPGRSTACGLSTLGYLVLLVGAHLGGDLAYRFGVGVNLAGLGDARRRVHASAGLRRPSREPADASRGGEQPIVLVPGRGSRSTPSASAARTWAARSPRAKSRAAALAAPGTARRSPWPTERCRRARRRPRSPPTKCACARAR